MTSVQVATGWALSEAGLSLPLTTSMQRVCNRAGRNLLDAEQEVEGARCTGTYKAARC